MSASNIQPNKHRDVHEKKTKQYKYEKKTHGLLHKPSKQIHFVSSGKVVQLKLIFPKPLEKIFTQWEYSQQKPTSLQTN